MKKTKSKVHTSFLLLGLGNPGAAYRRTRHNVGFSSLELAAGQFGIRLKRPWFRSYEIGRGKIHGVSCILVKPLTYMNKSGIILPALLKSSALSPESLIVLCDTMDLPPGAVRVRRGGGTAGHRGLASIIDEIGSKEFIRVYIGVGRPDDGVSVVDHVLGIPDTGTGKSIIDGVRKASDAAVDLLHMPIERVMNECNRKDAHNAGTQQH